MKNIILILAAIFSLSTVASVKIIKSDISFSASGKPAFIKANGSVPLLEATISLDGNIISGTAKVDLSKLDSGIELRDEHLKQKYLHTKKFPTAELVITKQKVQLTGEANKLNAILNFHGKEREIILHAELKKNKNIITFNSNFEFLLTDFDIDLPSFQGITAANNVKLKVHTTLEI